MKRKEREERKIAWAEMLLVWMQPQPRVPGGAGLAPASSASQRGLYTFRCALSGVQGPSGAESLSVDTNAEDYKGSAFGEALQLEADEVIFFTRADV